MLIDISPEISSRTAVFPGDTAFENTSLLRMEDGAAFALSKIVTTPHLGAHVDAPAHYQANGLGIGEVDLDPYYGLAQVIEVSLRPGQRIMPQHLKDKEIRAPRLLFKTKSFPDPNQWRNDFNALSPELIDFLASKKVILVGIDTPSVDLAQDKVLRTHHKLQQAKMANLEGIVLTSVLEGIYTLIALPLKIKGCDASPVRAVLIANESEVK